MRISLLHPTFFREGGAVSVRNRWLSAARFPDRIEYLVAVTESDKKAMAATASFPRIVVEPDDSGSTAVKNWNMLASVASGDLLFVIADDLEPAGDNWDSKLEELLQEWNPQVHAFALKVDDNGNPSDTQLRHPVVSRKYFEKHGLWDASYRGMWVDRDMTLTAFWRSRILDGRRLQFKHHNPVLERDITPSLSFMQANTEEEYSFGRSVFNRKWHPILQATRVRLVSTGFRPQRRILLIKLKLWEAAGLVWRSRVFWPLRRRTIALNQWIRKLAG